MKRGARKKMNVAKLHKHGPRGLVCLYAKDEAGVFEQNDLFVVDYDLDERAAGVAREGPMMFLFDIDSGRLCGLFQVVRVEMSVVPNAKISVEVRERYPPLEGAEVLEVARDLGLRLDNHFPEILNSTQVSNLVDVFQRKLQMHQQAYAHPGPMLVDGMYNEAPTPQPQRPRLYLAPQQPSFTENPWADEYDSLNGLDSPIQFDAARGGVMEPPPPHAPYAAPAATVESTRGVNLGLGMKPVLCTPPEQYGASYSHPIANHRSVPDPEAAAAAAGYGVSRHPRAAPVATVVPAAYNNIPYSNCADGMYAQQQQQQPAPLQQLRVPIKGGDDFVKGVVDYGQPGTSRSPLGTSHGVAAEAGSKPVSFREAASPAAAAAATGGKKGSGRKSVFNRIDEKKLFTKSFKKRQEHKQLQQQIADCEPMLREEKSKGRWVQTGKGGGSAFTRENKRESVFNRLDGLEDYETELPVQKQQQQRHLQKQQQQQQKLQQLQKQQQRQKLQQLQKQQQLQKHPQQCWQQYQQKQEQKVTWDDAQTSGHMINFRRDQNRKKPQKEVVVEQEEEQGPGPFVDGEESQPFIDFKRRSLNGSSSKRRENGNCSSDDHHNQEQEQEQPRSKKRRFVRPDGLRTGSVFRSEGVQLGCC